MSFVHEYNKNNIYDNNQLSSVRQVKPKGINEGSCASNILQGEYLKENQAVAPQPQIIHSFQH